MVVKYSKLVGKKRVLVTGLLAIKQQAFTTAPLTSKHKKNPNLRLDFFL